MAINLLTAAIIPYLMMALFETSAVLNVTQVVDPASVPIDVPILRKIPILGDIFNKQSPLTYLSFLAVAVLTLIYYKTDFGTHVRLVGDSREAAEAISASRGYICLSAINCGRKEPLKSAAFGLLFGFARALQIILANYLGTTLASLLEALPYITIIVVLVMTEIPNVRRNPMRIFAK